MTTISIKPPRPPTQLVVALRACAGAFGLVFLYSCGYNLFLLAPSIYLLQIYDRVLSSRSADTLLMLTMIIAIAVMITGCATKTPTKHTINPSSATTTLASIRQKSGQR